MSQQVGIDVKFEKSAEDDNFELFAEVQSTSGPMEDHIFLFDSQTGDFMHVVRPSDLNWPEQPDDSQKAFRSDTLRIVYESMEELREGRDKIEKSIQQLLDQYADDLGVFLGTDVVSFNPS